MGYVPFDDVQELLNMGEKPEDLFKYVNDFQEGFAMVKLNDKWYLIDTKGRLYDEDKQPITESFTGLQKRIYEAIQIGIRKGLRRF